MKCLCNHCSVTLEFEEEGVGQAIECPECKQETVLYELNDSKPDKEDAAETTSNPYTVQAQRPTTAPTEALLNGKSLDIGALIGGTIVIGILAVIAIAGGASQGSGIFSGIAGVVIACIAIVLSIVWAVLPFILYYQLDHQVRLLQFIAKKLVSENDYTSSKKAF